MDYEIPRISEFAELSPKIKTTKIVVFLLHVFFLHIFLLHVDC